MKVINPEKVKASFQANRVTRGLVSKDMGATKFRVNLQVITPGTGDNMHNHEESEQCHYVLKGQLTITTKQGARILRVGMMDWIPVGEDHQVQNSGKEDAHYMTITSPP